MLLGDVILVGWAHRPGLGNQSETFCLGEKKSKVILCTLQRAKISEPGKIEDKKENHGKNR